MQFSALANKFGFPVAVIALTAGSVLLSGAGAAYADGPKPGGGGSTVVPGATGSTGVAAPQGSNQPHPTNPGGVVHVQAGATGQGHADQKACDGYATRLNQLAGDKQEAANSQNLYLALAYQHIIDEVEDNALDAGCFIVY